jgi:hypothetical protein
MEKLPEEIAIEKVPQEIGEENITPTAKKSISKKDVKKKEVIVKKSIKDDVKTTKTDDNSIIDETIPELWDD